MKKFSRNFIRLGMGGSSLGLLLIAVLLATLLITGADSLEKRFALKQDHSFNGITTQSRETDQVLRNLDKRVHAYALFSPGKEDRALVGLLERYAARTSNFTFSLENLALNPALATSFSSSLKDNQVTSDSLVLHCEATGRTRVLDGSSYISQGYDTKSESIYIAGLNYERSLTEALIYVSADKLPQIQLLSGHGELTLEDIKSMQALLSRYSYSIREVNLQAGDELNPKEPLLILSPKKDLPKEQLDKLDAFARAGGSMFITADFSSAPSLPHFSALYRGYGFETRKGLVVAELSAQGSYYESPAVLVPTMESTDVSAALVAANQSSLLMAGSTAFDEPLPSDGLMVDVVLRSGNAFLKEFGSSFDSIEQDEADVRGRFPLALLSNRAFEDGQRSKAFIIGNSGMFTDLWMQQNTYSSELLLNVIGHLDPGEGIQIAIRPKDAIRPPYTPASPILTQLILVMLPAAVAATGLVVLLRRRRA